MHARMQMPWNSKRSCYSVSPLSQVLQEPPGREEQRHCPRACTACTRHMAGRDYRNVIPGGHCSIEMSHQNKERMAFPLQCESPQPGCGTSGRLSGGDPEAKSWLCIQTCSSPPCCSGALLAICSPPPPPPHPRADCSVPSRSA